MRYVLPYLGRGVPTGGTPYRYWRIYITALNIAGITVALNEVQLRGSIGGANIASGVPVSESSYSMDGEGGAYPGAATVDNNLSSLWVSAEFGYPPHWVRYDLTTAQVVAQVAIYSSGVSSNCPRDFQIQGSADGSSFTTVATFTGVATWGGWQDFTL